MDFVHKLILSDGFGWYMFSLFCILFIISIKFMHFRAKDKYSGMLEALKIIKENTEHNRQELTFTENFDLISQRIQKTNIARNWDEFVETLIPPLATVDHPDYKLYRNTKRPQVYFSYQDVFYHVRPGINSSTFVGLGLLLTFVGLIISLDATGSLFSSENSDDMITGLKMLLATAGAKFWASVSGLGASIVQEFIFAWQRNRDKALIDKFNDLLEESLVYASQERIAADQFGYSMRQAKEMESLADRLAVAIGDKVSEAVAEIPRALSTELNKTFEPIISDISKTAASMGDDNKDALAEMAKQFQDQISGASQSAMDGVVTQLNSLVGTLEQASEKIGQCSTQMNSSLESSFQDLKNIMMTVSDEMGRSSREASASFLESSNLVSSKMESAFETIAEQQVLSSKLIESLSSGVAKATNDISDSMSQQFGDSSKEMSNSIRHTLESVSEELSSFSHSMSDRVVQSSSEIQQSLSASVQDISKNVSETFEGTHQAILTNFEALSSRIESASSQLQESVDSWSLESKSTSTSLKEVNYTLGGINTDLKSSQAAIEQSTQSLATSSSSLNSMIDRASSVMDSVNQYVKRLVDSSESMSTHSQELVRLSEKSINEVNESISSLRLAWQSSAGRLEGLDKEMETAFNLLVNSLGKNLDKLTDFSNKLDSNATNAIMQLSSMVEVLSDSLEDITGKLR